MSRLGSQRRLVILLATYNGESWLDALLESLFAQTRQDWHLVVSDDASSDGTVALLNRWAYRHRGRISIGIQPRNLGYRENFRWLLKTIEADAYFLCDQDDVWLPEKIERCCQALNRVAPGRPGIAFSDLAVVGPHLETLEPSLWAHQRTDPTKVNDLTTLMLVNVVTGCAAVLNREARDLVADLSFEPAHDHAMALHVVRAGGCLVPIHESLVLYRQHANNTIGAKGFSSGFLQKVANLASPWGFRLARLGVEWGVFPSVTAFYVQKTKLWWARLIAR